MTIEMLVDEKDWLKYPENRPVVVGYYMTLYKNKEDNDEMYFKAIYFNGSVFCPWNPKGSFSDSDVEEFLPTTWAQYYTECLGKTAKIWNLEQHDISQDPSTH